MSHRTLPARRAAARLAPALLAALALAGPAPSQSAQPLHRGPAVAPGESGPARFVDALLGAYGAQRAYELTAFVDGWYRAPANEGYEAVLDRLTELLREAGYGEREGLELEILSSAEPVQAWTPRRARLELQLDGEEPRTLHAFEEPADRDRVMLPVNAPSANVAGPAVLELEDVREGCVLVTERRLAGRTLRDAERRGAVAVLSSSLNSFTLDPTGAERHLDAILFASVAEGTTLPVAYVSPRTRALVAALYEAGRAPRLAFQAEVELEQRPLRTLVARVVGRTRPADSVAIASHVQEPGAGDNATGVAGMAEAAAILARLFAAGKLERPARTLCFVWGDEFRQSSTWLAATSTKPVAGISADMLGQSAERTGAIMLLERMPDPGALKLLPPDEHTPWGAGRVRGEELAPNGLPVIARAALADVARAAGGWRTAEHPWEGGSDHDVFLRQGIPAVLLWHFTDFTYHTGLDRMEMVDAEELRRTSVAVLATALAVADAGPADLERYLASVELERALRVGAARDAEAQELIEQWEAWCDGAAGWLRELCAGE